VNWKIPGWAACAGAVVSLAAGLAGGNAFGTILLRVMVSALLAGALGFAARYVLRRFLPGFAAGAQEAPPAVDILIDEEIPVGGQAREEAEGEVGVLEAAGGEQLSDGAGSRPDYTTGYTTGSAMGGQSPADIEPFAAPAGKLDGLEAFEPAFDAVAESLEPAEGAEELPSAEALDALSAAESDGPADFSGVAAPGRRALKAEELEAQLDSVTKGQDPVSLAKAVRTFLRKDQEG
jgi:hypothetical protein